MSRSSPSPSELFLGIDVGTSGLRCCVIDGSGDIVTEARQPGAPVTTPRPGWVEQEAESWWRRLTACLAELPATVRRRIRRIAVDGTSSTLLLAGPDDQSLTPALMYNDSRATAEAARIKAIAPPDSAAHGASASLAKLLWLRDHHPDIEPAFALHQADWINGRLTGRWGISDYNNALKLGYDPIGLRWPDWIDQLPDLRTLLPTVSAPGETIARIAPDIADRFGLPHDATVVAGTTDSTAAFIATGASDIGDAVTSIGSTLVMKVISAEPVFAPEFGIYSHRLGDRWLAGGASNSGGAVLRHYFSVEEIEDLSRQIDPGHDSGLNFYPLLRPGERFPVNDPEYPPRIDAPEAHAPARFLHGLLEGIARIEARAYQRLHELGAPHPTRVLTAGGGARNATWLTMRERILGCPIVAARQTEAAYGAALLALRGNG